CAGNDDRGPLLVLLPPGSRPILRMDMKKLLLGIGSIFALVFVVACSGGDDEGEYKTEGPTATDNPSVAAPVSAGTAPGEAPVDNGGEAGASKGAAPRGRASKN